MTAAPPAPPAVAHPLPPARYEWLQAEVATWRRDGLLDDDQAAAVLGRYRSTHRLPLSRLLLGLGGAFLGVGLLWLVAANVDALPPLWRFGGVCLVWLSFLAGAEVLAARLAHGGGSPVVGGVRLAAALAFGAVVFQAAQSLQVPAYEPALVGWWAAGCLVHAYAVRDWAPLLVGVLAGGGWLLWDVAVATEEPLSVLAALAVVGVGSSAAAALHSGRWRRMGEPWRDLAALLSLTALFVGALPFVEVGSAVYPVSLLASAAVAGFLAVLALGRPGLDRLEVLGAIAAGGAAVLLVVWEAGSSVEDLGAVDLAHAAVSVAAYVLAAVGVAMVGAVRRSTWLTALATVSLVLFTTVQSFAVFSPILTGAWLFVALGAVFLGTGYLFDRARRELVASVVAADEPAGGAR